MSEESSKIYDDLRMSSEKILFINIWLANQLYDNIPTTKLYPGRVQLSFVNYTTWPRNNQ